MKRVFDLYHYFSPLLTIPLAYYLWWQQTNGAHWVVWLALAIPSVTAYIIPALGVNHFKLWKFHAPHLAGGFFPHHGLIFGGSISLLALLCVDMSAPASGWFGWVQAAFVTGSVLALWNWVFDAWLIKAGAMTVYNRAHFQGQPPVAIAAGYAPLYFFVFGAGYGLTLALSRDLLLRQARWDWWPWLLLGGLAVNLTLPTLLFVLDSYRRTGALGIYPYRKIAEK